MPVLCLGFRPCEISPLLSYHVHFVLNYSHHCSGNFQAAILMILQGCSFFDISRKYKLTAIFCSSGFYNHSASSSAMILKLKAHELYCRHINGTGHHRISCSLYFEQLRFSVVISIYLKRSFFEEGWELHLFVDIKINIQKVFRNHSFLVVLGSPLDRENEDFSIPGYVACFQNQIRFLICSVILKSNQRALGGFKRLLGIDDRYYKDDLILNTAS